MYLAPVKRILTPNTNGKQLEDSLKLKFLTKNKKKSLVIYFVVKKLRITQKICKDINN